MKDRPPSRSSQFRLLACFGFAAIAATTAGCKKAAPPAQQPPPPEVGVITAKSESVPLTQTLVGRLSALRTADVRARVAGVLQKRVYTEGTDVKEGQLLFQIDPAPLRATLNAQLAGLSSAQATYANDHIAAERARAVAAKGLLSKSDVDDAQAAERTSAASVKQAQANAESAKINLGYTNVVAPIAGRAGQQQVTEGALVGESSTTLLTTVEQIDPVYVNFSQAVGQLDALRRAAATGNVHLAAQNQAKVELLRADGAPTGESGVLDFSDTAVDASTGAVSLRATVANPQHTLLPGQYVNVRLTMGDLAKAWRIPQGAVLRDAQGAYVMVIGGDGNVAQKRVQTSTSQEGNWIVTDGLADGDQVIVSGVVKVRPGAPAKGTPLVKDAAPRGKGEAAPAG